MLTIYILFQLFKKRAAALLPSTVHQAHYGAVPHCWRLFILYVRTWNVVWVLTLNVLPKSTGFIWCTALMYCFFDSYLPQVFLLSFMAGLNPGIHFMNTENDIKNTTTQEQAWCAKCGNQLNPTWTKINKQLLNIEFSFYTLLKTSHLLFLSSQETLSELYVTIIFLSLVHFSSYNEYKKTLRVACGHGDTHL